MNPAVIDPRSGRRVDRLTEHLATRAGLPRVVESGLHESLAAGPADAVVCCFVSVRDLEPSSELVGRLRSMMVDTPFAVVVGVPAKRRRRNVLRRQTRGASLVPLLAVDGHPDLLAGRLGGDGADADSEVVIGGFAAATPPPEGELRVAAIIHVHNDGDVLGEVIEHLAHEGVEVHIFDNWSTDGSWEVAQDGVRRGLVANLERLPAAGPPLEQRWADQLDHTAAYAASLDVDWVIHHDADEIRTSPWRGVRLSDAIARVDALGYNAIDFTVIDFRFLRGAPTAQAPFEQALTHFEFGRRPGHFLQIKGWKNSGPVDLSSSGGHEAVFEHRRVFPLKFLLKHYPLRTEAQAQRKIFVDRAARHAQERTTRGWHTQYDRYRDGDPVGWNAEDLTVWDPVAFDRDFLIERVSGVGLADE